jgi:hypothetical protein
MTPANSCPVRPSRLMPGVYAQAQGFGIRSEV